MSLVYLRLPTVYCALKISVDLSLEYADQKIATVVMILKGHYAETV